MKLNTQQQTLSETIYACLLKFYPRRYQQQFGTDMFFAFRDMLAENTSSTVWFTVLKELPTSIVREYIAERKGGELTIKRNLFPVIAGIVSVTALYFIIVPFTSLLAERYNFYGPIRPLGPFFHELNGPMSLYLWLAYFISGSVVGLLAKKNQLRLSALTGAIAFVSYALIELPDWYYYFGYVKHPLPFQWFTFFYFCELAVAMVLLFTVGGFLGKTIQRQMKRESVNLKTAIKMKKGKIGRVHV